MNVDNPLSQSHQLPHANDSEDAATQESDASQSLPSQDFELSQSTSHQDSESGNTQNENFHAENCFVGPQAIAIASSIVKCSLTQLCKYYLTFSFKANKFLRAGDNFHLLRLNTKLHIFGCILCHTI